MGSFISAFSCSLGSFDDDSAMDVCFDESNSHDYDTSRSKEVTRRTRFIFLVFKFYTGHSLFFLSLSPVYSLIVSPYFSN